MTTIHIFTNECGCVIKIWSAEEYVVHPCQQHKDDTNLRVELSLAIPGIFQRIEDAKEGENGGLA